MARPRPPSDRQLLEAERWLIPQPAPEGRAAALCYPSSYHVGMSNLGLHRLLELVAEQPGWAPLRAFLPAPEREAELRRRGERLRTLDHAVRLDQVDLWLVSVSYEEDYLGLWRMLTLAGLPPLARDREPDGPLVVVGGFAPTLNPEPVAPLADVLLLGPAEQTLAPFLRRWGGSLERVGGRQGGRPDLDESLAGLPGCYVPGSPPPPRLVVPSRAPAWDPAVGGRLCVDHGLERPPPRTRVLTPHTVFADRYLVAVGDGCPGACRFCAASFAHRPPRAYPEVSLRRAVDEGLAHTPRIGLLGAAVSDLPSLGTLAHQVRVAGGELSTSSLRVGIRLADGPPIVGRTATIAPEAASEVLRRTVNKPMTDDEVLETLTGCVEAGAVRVRAYLLLGLPGADDGEADALLDLALRGRDALVAAGRGRGRPAELVLSVNAFVPKPDTPFQWAGMASPDVLDRRAERLRRGLRAEGGGVRLLWGGSRIALRQAALSLGDRDAVDLLPPSRGSWWTELRRWHGGRGEFAFGDKPRDHAFPWRFVDRGVSRDFLWREWQRARAGKLTPACDVHDCRACGVCG